MAVEAAKQGKVKQLVLFHHDPAYNDAHLDQMAKHARGLFKNVMMAREGVVIDVARGTVHEP
jgi:ribonuclease BN (tRNA processing enzyme)